MKRILLLIDNLGSGGSQRQLVELAKGLKENNYDVFVLTYLDRNFYQIVLDDKKIQTLCINEKSYFKRLWKIRKFIRNSNFDCVISFLDVPNFISIVSGLPFKKWKIIIGERSSNPRILKSFRAKFYRKFFYFADAVVANSFANIELIKQIVHIPERKINVIYNIVDFNKWRNNEKYVFRKNGILKIVVPASHRYLKNLKSLILGVNELTPHERKSLLIEWYGDNINGNYFDHSYPEAVQLIEECGLKGNFSFYPATHNISTIIMEADVVGLFSFYEGLPNAICEGMASAKPVIATKISDNYLFVKNDKLLCEPNSPSSITDSLRYLLSLSSIELQAIGTANRLKAEELFNSKIIIDKFIKLIQ